jgi:L-malate glycosyltransferase
MYKDYEFAMLHGFQNSVVIPNGVDEEEFSKSSSINFREKYNITTPYLGLCVANFYKGKGHDRVIEAVRQMNRPDFTMIFIGKEGDELEALKKQSDGLHIRFLVNIPREDTVAAYHAADIFLFGSDIEASPLVIIEAKASKTPFVSTDCGNVKEWKGGIVCKPEEMAGNATRLLEHESVRIQLAEEGYKEWKEKLTWEAVVDKYEDLYLRLHHAKFQQNWNLHVMEIQKNIEKNYSDISLYLQAAELLIQKNELDKAIKYLEDASEIDQNNPALLKLYDRINKEL